MTHLQKLVTLFVIILGLMGAFKLYKSGLIPIGPSYEQVHAELFSGIQKISPQQVLALFPEAHRKPVLVEFQSKYCMDCQRMRPILTDFEQGMKKHPQDSIKFYRYDISLDRKTYPQVFQAFQPTMVPVVIFIAPGGKVEDVLYGYHNKRELDQSLLRIQPNA